MSNNDLVRVETNILPRAQLIIVFSSLAFALLIRFIDQKTIGIALPTIGKDLNAATTIAWAGTSSLIANTVFRKVVFLSAVGLLALGDILCSFAKTGPQLYAFRGISGVGNGGITALAMIIVSDIVTLENRGKYQGILGSCVGLGNTIGPFLAAAFIEKATWRALFWCICPLVVLAGGLVALTLPPSRVHGDMNAKVKAIDYFGVLFNSSAILLLLIPISGSGTYFDCNSPMAISMLTLGTICTILFIIVEWEFAAMPMMPLRLFKNPAVSAILIQNFLYGFAYYSHLYYLPIYYQNVRGFSPILSAALTIPFVAAQSVPSISSGRYVSRLKRYGEIIVVFLMIEGAGVGHVFQPTLVAAQAHSTKADRAVVISVRNFLRALGGSLGLALSSAIFSNKLASTLNSAKIPLPADVKAGILAAILRVPDLAALTTVEQNEVLDAYMAASKAVFTVWVPFMGACLVLFVLIKDEGLTRPDEKPRVDEAEGSETPAGEESDIEMQGRRVESTDQTE